MKNQERKPDFVVDPYGNVEKVNPQTYSQESTRTNTQPVPIKKSNTGTWQNSSIRYYIIPIPIGLIGMLIILLFSSTKEGRINKHMARGNDYLESGEYFKAITEFDQVLKIQSDHELANLDRAVANIALENFVDAILDCNKALERFPNHSRGFLIRGAAFFSIGDLEKAIEDFTRAIQISPSMAEAYSNRGLCYQKLGDYDKAIDDFTKAIENTLDLFFLPVNTPDFDSWHYQQRVRELNSRQIKLDIDLPSIYENRGLVYFLKSDFDQALQDFNKAIELEPYLSSAYFFRGCAQMAVMNIDAAIQDFETVILLDNDLEYQKEAEDLLNEIIMSED